MAIINNDKRAATVTALEPVECLLLDRIPFINLLGELEELVEEARSRKRVISENTEQVSGIVP